MYLAAAGLVLSATGCSKNGPEISSTVGMNMGAAVIPVNNPSDGYFTNGNFQFQFENLNCLLRVTDLKLPDDTKVDLSVNAPYRDFYFTDNSSVSQLNCLGKTFTSTKPDGASVSNVIAAFVNGVVKYPGGGMITMPATIYTPVVSMRMGNYNIASVPLNCYYKGITKSNIGNFESTDGYYGVSIDATTNKAMVVIYEIRFAEKMPKLNIVLRDLDVVFTTKGYSIVGSNVVPEMLEGTSSTPNPNFKFDSFDLTSRFDRMGEISLQVHVAGRYEGQFTGAYGPLVILEDPNSYFKK